MNLDALIKMIPSDILGQISGSLGESEANVNKGLQGGIGAILASLLGQIGNPGKLTEIVGMLAGKNLDLNSLLPLISGLTRGDSAGLMGLGKGFLDGVLGDKSAVVAQGLAESVGLKPQNGPLLMGLAAPLAMKAVQENSGGTADGLVRWLNDNKSLIMGLVPSGLVGALGLPKLTLPSVEVPDVNLPRVEVPRVDVPRVEAPRVAVPRVDVPPVTVPEPEGNRWLIPGLIGLLAIGGLGWYLSNNLNPAAVETPKVNVPKVDVPKVDVPKVDISLREITLPGDIRLNVPETSLEAKLAEFIVDAARPVDDTTWFNFDNLLFDTDEATLQAGSRTQLENLAAILKAYPNVNIKIGGYTDNTGDPAANMKLSADRANTVMNELVALGIDAARLEAEGYGEQFPVGDNSTEEGRQANRRIAVRVTKK